MLPYSADNDQPPPIPLFCGGDEPHVSPYHGPLTAQYSEVKRDVTLHVIPRTSTTSGGDYSVLKRDNIPHESLLNVTAGGDYSFISRDDVPYGTAAGDYSVLKREEREVS